MTKNKRNKRGFEVSEGPSLALAALLLAALPACASEIRIWTLGQVDHSEHEFGPSPASPNDHQETVVRVGKGGEERRWPKFHPGSGNGALGGRSWRYVLEFELPASPPPAGVFYLELNLLFRQPRVPALDLDINGHPGRYYFDPNPMFELGDVADEFNVIRSAQHRRLALPASLFKPGPNRFAFTAVDDPPVVVNNHNVATSGDSGFFYDALSLSQDPEAVASETFEATIEPTVFFPKSGKAVREQCYLRVHYPASWPGGIARITLGKFIIELSTPKPAEFGEARYPFLAPGDLPDGPGEVDFFPGKGATKLTMSGAKVAQVCQVTFTPAKKWKIFYAPNEHLDVGYTDYRAKVAEVHARCMDQLLETLKAHPQFRFNLDGSWIADQWLGLRSDRHAAQLIPYARAGQVGMNAFYCSVATEYPSIEENIRNLYTSKELQQRFGIPFDFALVTDVPSVSWSTPSVLASAGIRYFANGGNQDRGPMLVHGHWNVRSPFWWEGPDGQRVLTWFSSHYHQFKALFGLPPAMESGLGGVSRFLKAYQQAGYVPDAVLLYGTEVENLPTQYDDASFVERWNSTYAWPRLVTCQFSDFFRYIEKNYSAGLPVVRGTGGSFWADNFGILAAATARDRANQSRAIIAETFATLASALDPRLRFPRELDHEIWQTLLLYAEHNFGIGGLNDRPDCDAAIGIVNEKEDQTVRAAGDIDKLVRLGFSQLADRIQTEGQNLLVFNSLSWPRSGLVQCQVDQGVLLTNLVTGLPVECEVLALKDGVQTIRFWAENVPAVGYKVYRLGRGRSRSRATISEPLVDNVVENRFYKIRLDPLRAALKSIYDKELRRELVEAASPYAANEYFFVDGGGTETGRGRGVEDSQLMHPFDWLPPAQLTIHHAEQGTVAGIERTPWGQRIRMSASALHTPRIETEILLPDELKQIEFRNVVQVDLLLAKQASYFAFPWSPPAAKFRYDIPNGFVDPEHDLLEGGCSDWFSIQHLVNVEADNLSVNLAAVDAPLVCLGDIYRGKWLARFTNCSSTVFSYALNNYWSPKWAGKKSAELRYRYVVASAGRFAPARSARWGREACFPLEIAFLKSSDKLPGRRGVLPPAQAAFVSLEPENIVLTALKPAEDGKGLVVRMLETTGRDTEGLLELPFLHVDSAREANAVEVAGKSLRSDTAGLHFHIKPHEVLTIRVKAAQL